MLGRDVKTQHDTTIPRATRAGMRVHDHALHYDARRKSAKDQKREKATENDDEAANEDQADPGLR